jgi:hypothetical protein
LLFKQEKLGSSIPASCRDVLATEWAHINVITEVSISGILGQINTIYGAFGRHMEGIGRTLAYGDWMQVCNTGLRSEQEGGRYEERRALGEFLVVLCWFRFDRVCMLPEKDHFRAVDARVMNLPVGLSRWHKMLNEMG